MIKLSTGAVVAGALLCVLARPLVAETIVEPLFSVSPGCNDNYTLALDGSLNESVSVGNGELGVEMLNATLTSTPRLVPRISGIRIGCRTEIRCK